MILSRQDPSSILDPFFEQAEQFFLGQPELQDLGLRLHLRLMLLWEDGMMNEWRHYSIMAVNGRDFLEFYLKMTL